MTYTRAYYYAGGTFVLIAITDPFRHVLIWFVENNVIRNRLSIRRRGRVGFRVLDVFYS